MSLRGQAVKNPSRTLNLQAFGGWMLAVGALFVLSACESDGDTPTKPSAGLTVQPFSTETAPDLIAIRVRVRMRVTSGLTDLADAVQSGRASTEVCADTCNSGPVVPGPVLGQCNTAVGAGVAEVASASLDGDEVSVEFCIPITTAVENYTSTVSDGTRESNAVTTSCSLSGGILTCGSE
jgi:hypothetical protein